MNKAESERLGRDLQQLGYEPVERVEEADMAVVNSCVVRQSAEDKVLNKLANLKAFKRNHPELILALTGCMVGSRFDELKSHFPYIDFFLKPQSFNELLAYAERNWPAKGSKPLLRPSEFVPIIQGCDNFCSYCIVPYRRGREKSRLMAEIIHEVQDFVKRGVKEVTLLGQNVDSYGHDLPDKPDLADLLREINQIEGLARIRFLTSHPKDVNQKLIDAVASLDKVCEHISLPIQAGDNDILKAMRRGYTIEQYCDLISRIRSAIPGVALSADVIVGFPNESEEKFQHTVDLVKRLRFDKVHVAAYSTRPGTIACRKFEDNVPLLEKKSRLQEIERIQKGIAAEINSKLLFQKVEILVEGQKKGKWQGRTRTDKLVFFESAVNCVGQLVQVKIKHTSPWSLQGIPV